MIESLALSPAWKRELRGMRVTFHSDHNAGKEAQRSLVGQALRQWQKEYRRKRKLYEEVEKEKKKVAHEKASMPEEKKLDMMKKAVERMKQDIDGMTELYDRSKREKPKCITVKDILEDHSRCSFRTDLSKLLSMAQVGKSNSIRERLEWFQQKDMSYQDFIQQKKYMAMRLWWMCTNDFYLRHYNTQDVTNSSVCPDEVRAHPAKSVVAENNKASKKRNVSTALEEQEKNDLGYESQTQKKIRLD